MENFITEIDILKESKDCFLQYTEEVLTDRAIPSAEDGLLSVHRKLLWTMGEVLGMNNKSKYKKSASIVGSTLASSYFHGDSACYDALCKITQPYLMRYPLADTDGNMGTQEGNNMQAAARYTNCKPSQYADLMLNNFDKKVVPLKETYNGEYMEPVVLPSPLPNAIVNGREAIAVGMAHNSLPHNLTEVCDGIIAYIKNNDIDTAGLMEYIKGPDFPLPCTVVNQKDIYAAFDTGHSQNSLKVRGIYEINNDEIIFTSIPYRTYRNKIKEQLNKNIDIFEKYLEDFADESNIGNNRLIFKVKKGVSVKLALDKLFELTDLQTTLSYNMNYIVNGTPKICSLKDLIVAYVNHQISILIKIAEFDKTKAEARIHILEALIKATDKINDVIELIKSSNNKEDARNKLIKFLDIDEIQANAILDMKLARLTKIDKEELSNELKNQKLVVEECNKIITNEEYRNNKLILMIENMKAKYGDARRTILANIDIIKSKAEKEIAYVEPEKCVVVLTANGYIKRIPVTSFRVQKRNGTGIKNAGEVVVDTIRTNTIDSLMVFTNKGKVYKFLVNNIPECTNAAPGTSLRALIAMDSDEEASTIYSLYRDTTATHITFVTQLGQIKKTALSEFSKSRNSRNGTTAIKLREGDSIVSAFLSSDESVILISSSGMAICINSSSISIQGKTGGGTCGMKLGKDDRLIAALPIRNKEDNLAIFLKNGAAKRIEGNFTPQNRGGKGIKIAPAGKIVAAAQMVADDDIILVNGIGNSICINASDISIMGRVAQGNMVIKGSEITSVSKI